MGVIKMKPYNEQTIIEKLRNRATIRRKIGRKADGKPDRIANECEEAANEIENLTNQLEEMYIDVRQLGSELQFLSRNQRNEL